MKRIAVCVTNDLTYDQRMIRTCRTLVAASYEVELIGRELAHSKPVLEQPFSQVRLQCTVNKGPMFYAEYNRRLSRYLIRSRPDLIVSCDLDTILASMVSAKRIGIPFVYDSHEYFTEVPELDGREVVKGIWRRIGNYAVPRSSQRYTVGPRLAEELSSRYGVPFNFVRNVPYRSRRSPIPYSERERVILYQGALNKGRGLEAMIDAMKHLDHLSLHLVGEGDISSLLRERVRNAGVEDRVIFRGRIEPQELPEITDNVLVGINLLENTSRSYYFSLANKFFDYLQAGTPSLNMNFPEYAGIIEQYPIGLMLADLEASSIVSAISEMVNESRWESMHLEALSIADKFCWENESDLLLEIIDSVFASSGKLT